MDLVLDSSIVACWCLPDEASPVADAVADRLGEEVAIVPTLWWFEVRNVLLINERRGRIEAADTAQLVANLERLPVRIDRAPKGDSILWLGRLHRLTFYDASYLELALRLGVPLATLDRALAAAARASGVPVLGENGV
jgi:predicted nucleic acid-binding protein